MQKNVLIGMAAGLVFSLLASGSVLAETDTKGPELIVPETMAVDVSDNSLETKVQFEVRIKDELSGFKRGYITVVSPSGDKKHCVRIDKFDMISGDMHNGLYNVEIEIPRYAEIGIWNLDNVVLIDNVSNSTKKWSHHPILTADI